MARVSFTKSGQNSVEQGGSVMDMTATSMDDRSGRRDALRKAGGLGAVLLAALGLVEPAAAGKRHGFQTRLEVSSNSAALPATAGSTVLATADCGGVGKVISCGHQTPASADQLVNVFISFVEPNSDRSNCSVEIIRTAEAGSTAGAKIQAVAICRV
jgi:hypothetical protein